MSDLDKRFAQYRKKKITPKADEPSIVPKPSKKSVIGHIKKKVVQKKEHHEKLKQLKDKIKAHESKETQTSQKETVVKKWSSSRKIKKLESEVKKTDEKDKKIAKAKTKDIHRTLKKEQKKRKKLTPSQRRRQFKTFLEMAGWENVVPHKVARDFFRLNILILTAATSYMIYFFATSKEAYALSFIFTITVAIWTLGFVLILLILWMMFYLSLDLMMFRRKLAVETVLPDFLQLTSANIRAGMPIDQALWYAVRPRFGVLAKEIEMVAKETLSGTDLNSALMKFGEKYDSVILKRSLSLLIEGINAGGEIGDLLNKISLNIQETRIMKKEMAASVTTYVIFIGFATAMAAPVLFALSYQLLVIIKDITAKLAASNVGSAGALSFSISGDAVSLFDFQIFALASLVMTSFFSSVIIAIIKKGNLKEGISYIPVFIVVTLIMFWIAKKVLGATLGGLI